MSGEVLKKGIVKDLAQCKRPCIITEDMKTFIEEELLKNDEIMSTNMIWLLPRCLMLKCQFLPQQQMGWVCTRPPYCQFLRDVSTLYFCDHKVLFVYVLNFRSIREETQLVL